MLRSVFLAALIASAATLPASEAWASGFYLQEQSSKGAGRAYSGEVADHGAASLWWNPAAVAGMLQPEIYLGFSAILPSDDVVDRGTRIVRPGQPFALVGGQASDSRNPIRNGFLPSGAIAMPLSSRLAAGLALGAPYSFTTRYGAASWTRYSALESRLRTYDIQPSLAATPVPGLRVGGALNVERMSATLSNALPNLSPLLPDGYQQLSGSGWNVGFSGGAQLDAGPIALGASYKSSIRHAFGGRVAIGGLLGPLAGQNGVTATNASFRTPWQFDLGARARVSSRLTLDGQINRVGWGRFDAIRLGAPLNAALPEGYRDTWSVAGGADYAVTPIWTVRAGVQHDQTPTRDGQRDARVPDGDHWNIAAGTSYRWSRLTMDVAATYISVADVTIDRNTAAFAGTAVQTPILTAGEAQNGHVVTLSLGAHLLL